MVIDDQKWTLGGRAWLPKPKENTAKGLAVTKLNKIESEPSQEFFIKPERFIKTRNSDPRRGEVFFRAPVSSRYFKSPDDAEAEVRKQIKYHGANALLNAQMQQERRRNGNYVYRVFKLTGDCALVMEKAHSKSGEACMSPMSEIITVSSVLSIAQVVSLRTGKNEETRQSTLNN